MAGFLRPTHPYHEDTAVDILNKPAPGATSAGVMRSGIWPPGARLEPAWLGYRYQPIHSLIDSLLRLSDKRLRLILPD
jgi:hypothetical protein